MSFKPVNLVLQSMPPLNVQPQTLPRLWAYLTVDDTVATVSAAGYFNADPGTLLQDIDFNIGDQVYCVCSDAAVQLFLTAVGSTGTTTMAVTVGINSVATADIQNLAVTTAKIDNLAVTNGKLAADAVTNVKVAAAAAIDFSKLAALASGNIIVGSAGTVPTSVAMSGDVAIIASGATTIQANAVTTAKIIDAAVTTAKLDATTIQYVKVPMTAAEWNGMYAAPKLLVAAPAAGKQIVVQRAVAAMTFVAAQYAAGGAVALQYDSTVHGAGPLASATLAAATVNAYAASSDVGLDGADTSGASSTKTAKGLYISNDTGAFTTGDGTWNIHVWYEVVTL